MTTLKQTFSKRLADKKAALAESLNHPEDRTYRARLRRAIQTGAVSIEMLFYIIVILVIVAITLYNIPTILDYVHELEAEDQLTTLVTRIRGKYAQQTSYTTLTNANAITINVVPTSMINGVNIINAFQGAVTLGSATIGGISYMTVELDGIPQEVCIDMVQNNGGAEEFKNSAGGAWAAPPTDPVTAATYCTNVTSNSLFYAYR